MWEKTSNSRWQNSFGNVILKYKMGPNYYFLCYDNVNDIEFGDYVTKSSLKDAKKYLDERCATVFHGAISLLSEVTNSECRGVDFKNKFTEIMELKR